jgi:hypothetical protein
MLARGEKCSQGRQADFARADEEDAHYAFSAAAFLMARDADVVVPWLAPLIFRRS